jgi:hypothetical protein
MFQRRLSRRAAPILIVCLVGIITSNAAAVHTPGLASLGGWVYIDRNNDGHLAFSNEPNPEFVIGDVTVNLFTKSNNVESLFATTQSDQFGRYFFDNLAAGTYVLREVQPIEFVDGIDTLGQLFSWINQPVPPNASAGTAANDAFLNIVLQPNVQGEYYNFGERGLAAGFASKRFLTANPPTFNTAVPEPASALLLLAAMSGILCARRGRRS